MAINIVQVCSASATFSFAGTANDSLTATFTNPVTQGNTILVLLGEDLQGLVGIALNSVTDTVGNSYNVPYEDWQGASAGAGSALAIATNITGGSDTVTASLNLTAIIGTQSARFGVLCIELSGVPTGASLFSTATFAVFGAGGNNPVSVTINDSFGNTVTVTFGGTSGSGGPGTSVNLNLFDLLGGGVNFLCAWCVSQAGTNVPTADHGYSFTLSENVTVGMTFHFYSPGLPFATVQQPQIFVVTYPM